MACQVVHITVDTIRDAMEGLNSIDCDADLSSITIISLNDPVCKIANSGCHFFIL